MKDIYYTYMDYSSFEKVLKERNIHYELQHDGMHRFILKNNIGMKIVVSFYKTTENSGYFGDVSIKYGSFYSCVEGRDLDVTFKDDRAWFIIKTPLEDNCNESVLEVGMLIQNKRDL